MLAPQIARWENGTVESENPLLREVARSLRSKQPTGKQRRLHDEIANWLGAAILSGRYPPGTTLSGEVEFSEALAVSRTAYREAVQVLVGKGLVESRPKTGTRVLPRERWNLLDPEVLAWAFAGEPDIDFVRQLFELRAIVEPAAAALAAERRSPADLTAMEAALSAMTRHTLTTDAGRTADRDFHDAILRATRNDALVALSSSIGAAVEWSTVFKHRTRGLLRDSIPEHGRVYEAIASGDPRGAREGMHALIDLAHKDTRLSLRKRSKA
jgi:DNA-binding FadR family transcriptional regulator